MSEPLRPCPFCGQVPTDIQLTDGHKWGAVVCCIVGPEVRTGYQDLEHWRDDAIEAWNTRARTPESKNEHSESQETR